MLYHNYKSLSEEYRKIIIAARKKKGSMSSHTKSKKDVSDTNRQLSTNYPKPKLK